MNIVRARVLVGLFVPLVVAAGVGVAHAAPPRAGVETSWMLLTSQEQLQVIAVDLVGVAPLTPGLELQLRLPTAHAWTDQGSGTTIGNLTAGVRVARRTPGARTGVAMWQRASVSLSVPTAPRGGDRGGAGRAAADALVLRDAGAFRPGMTTLRIGGELEVAAPRWFVQLAAGVDVVLDRDATSLTDSYNLYYVEDGHPRLRFGAMAGGQVIADLEAGAAATFRMTVRGNSDDRIESGVGAWLRYAWPGTDTTITAHVDVPFRHPFPFGEAVGAGLGVERTF